jgi:hypothetical protein
MHGVQRVLMMLMDYSYNAATRSLRWQPLAAAIRALVCHCVSFRNNLGHRRHFAAAQTGTANHQFAQTVKQAIADIVFGC